MKKSAVLIALIASVSASRNFKTLNQLKLESFM